MYMEKYPHPSHFAYDQVNVGTRDGKNRLRVEAFQGDVFRLIITGTSWQDAAGIATLQLPPIRKDAGATVLSVETDGALEWRDVRGKLLLRSYPDRAVGLCGQASIFNFVTPRNARFYGMGEKSGPLEKSCLRTKFWNTDVGADFAPSLTEANKADPMYVAVPYMAVQTPHGWLGLLLDNFCETFMLTTSDVSDGLGKKAPRGFSLGSANGRPILLLLYGPSLAELTRKLQQIVGAVPRPPLWALGHHQCRWGYETREHLQWLQRNFRRRGIPVDGLWLDIGYMRGYRVFTVDRRRQPSWRHTLRDLAADNLHVVPILDPGVKQESGYSVYEDGVQHDVFCKTAAGVEFVGMVWPGRTVFPDFSMEEGRRWWARHVAAFAREGVHGAWLDMNDPATGFVNPQGMRFGRGHWPHDRYHNAYALGMARASFEGLMAAHPEQRPFLLCRSGSTGISRYAATWTGDNYSNYAWLQGCIPTSLNLSLSGVPFNGPDIGGFFGDASEELMVRWEKACFLFPFHRIHTCINTRAQEPWAFSRRAADVLRHYIRLRYRFLPYLYQLFVAQEQDGDPILRPLFYEFSEAAAMPPPRLEDQFMVGPVLLQAPQVTEAKERDVLLPSGAWFDFATGIWRQEGGKLRRKEEPETTPLFGREGFIVPMRPAGEWHRPTDLRRVELHVLMRRKGAGRTGITYVADDGQSFDYRRGIVSRMKMNVSVKGDGIEVRMEAEQTAYGRLQVRPFFYDRFRCAQIWVNGRRIFEGRPQTNTVRFTGKAFRLGSAPWITV